MDIPAELQSDYGEGFFICCSRCGEGMEDMPEGYQISKLISGGETIYEYALCHPCHSGLLAQFSPESRTRLELFHSEHVSLNMREHHCAVCGRERHQHPEFALTAACLRDQVLHQLMLCGPCRREMDALLSPHTRRVWEDFISENLPGIPAGAPSPSPLELLPH